MSDTIKKTFNVDKNSPVPMYFQIKQEIIKLIKNNTYKTGDQLPTELEFCKILDISRPTIRQAFQELINEGYITRQKAKGTFVSKPKVEGYFFKKLESYNEEMRALGLEPSTNVLHSEVEKASEEVATKLNIKEGEEVFHLVRQRFADEEPMVYVHTYLPYAPYKSIEENDFNDESISLYELMKHKYNRPIAYVDRTIEASNATNDIATLLHIEDKAAIYTITTIAHDEDDMPIEYSVARYRGDRNKFSIRLVQQ